MFEGNLKLVDMEIKETAKGNVIYLLTFIDGKYNKITLFTDKETFNTSKKETNYNVEIKIIEVGYDKKVYLTSLKPVK